MLFPGYIVEAGAVSDNVVARSAKHSKASGTVMSDLPRLDIAWLKVISYVSFASCGLEWKRLNSEMDEEKSLVMMISRIKTYWNYYCCATQVETKVKVLLSLAW